MTVGEVPVETILEAIRRHLETRHVCTLATARGDLPWAASCFYASRDFDLYVCQRKDARTLANMLANPRVGFAVDDRRTEAWLQGRGPVAVVTGSDEAWGREQLLQAAPEFVRHFSNPDYPVLRIQPEELNFVDRSNKIRTCLMRRDGRWGFADER